MIAVLIAWLILAAVVALGIGRAIRLADVRRPEPDWLADQPAEVLAPAEIARRIAIYEREMAA